MILPCDVSVILYIFIQPSSALYGALGLADVLGAGSVGSLKTGLVAAIKSGGKLVMGSGFAESAASTAGKVVILNKGSTGRTESAGLLEELAMEATKADPLAAATRIEGVQLTDSRWLAEDGWVKMQNTVKTSRGEINFHFNYNTKTNEFDDFKFINPEIVESCNPYRDGIEK